MRLKFADEADIPKFQEIFLKCLHHAPQELIENNIHMTIEVVHCNGCPLDLDQLLTSSEDDFLHDVCGIEDNICRISGQLRNCFLPRCALSQAERRARPELTLQQKIILQHLVKYPIQVDTKHFNINIDHAQKYGYFEHETLGDARGGGLWFENKTLKDYDGVYSLPVQVGEALEKLGFNLGDCKP